MIENGGKNVDSAAAEGDRLVSILIVSRDRRRHLETLVARLKGMDTRHRYEIVVVEETNRPEPLEGVTYVPHPVAGLGIPYARNLALANANGELVVFIDDDCTVPDQWLNKLLTPFRNERVVGVQGGVTVPPDTNPVGWAETILGFPGGGIRRVYRAKGKTQNTIEISTLNCAYRKWVVDSVGDFDERLLYGGEDYLFAKIACDHGRCVFVPDAMVFHKPRGSLARIFFWFYRRGKAEFCLAQTGWQMKRFISYWLRSSLLLKIFVLLVLAILVSDRLLLISAAFVVYYFATFLRYARDCKGCGAPLAGFVLLPLVKTVMDLGIDCGRFSSLFLRN